MSLQRGPALPVVVLFLVNADVVVVARRGQKLQSCHTDMRIKHRLVGRAVLWGRTHLLRRVPRDMFDVLCVTVNDSHTLIIVLFIHWGTQNTCDYDEESLRAMKS